MDLNALQVHNTEYHGQTIWDQVLEQLLHEYGETVFKNWLSAITFQELRHDTLILSVPTKFVREWVISHYLAKIRKFVEVLAPEITKVDMRTPHTPQYRDTSTGETKIGGMHQAQAPLHKVKCDFTKTSPLNPNLVFENFICGKENQVAYNAARSIIGCNVDSYAYYMPQCLYIHGSVGMGKTHILQSIASYTMSHNPTKKVAYLSVERFMHNYINAVRSNEVLAFRDHLRASDILLLDDLQFICDKSSTQKEFTQTFDAIMESNKVIIIASDRPPYNLPLEARIKSRLISSISVEIQNPNFDLRLSILQSKAKLVDAKIDHAILEFIADKVASNVRELEGAFYKVLAHCSLANLPVTLENAKIVLRDALVAAPKTQLSIASIIEAVAGFYNLNKSDITAKHRFSKSVIARQISAYLAKNLTSLSLQEIGKKLGGRDHATIIYSIKQVEQKISDNHAISSDISKIKEMLRSVNSSL